MNTKRGLIAGAAVAGAIALGGSAYTATSTIDDPAVNVGSVEQLISGATITNVVHTYTAASDTTTAIDAKAEELLEDGSVTIEVNGGVPNGAEACSVARTDVNADGIDDGAGDFTDITCDIVDTVNVTSIRFIVNG
jgi:hypothetical protein